VGTLNEDIGIFERIIDSTGPKSTDKRRLLVVEPRPIPFAFARDHISLTWPEVAWGYRNGWFDAAGVVEYALSVLGEDHLNAPRETVDLAALAPSEFAQVPAMLEKVATAIEPNDQSASDRRLLFLILYWAYENRSKLQDPLGIVESLYADFGYPPEVRSFVRYMPPDENYEPNAHSFAENEKRLFDRWEGYLKSPI
jgi:hypothetical protein